MLFRMLSSCAAMHCSILLALTLLFSPAASTIITRTRCDTYYSTQSQKSVSTWRVSRPQYSMVAATKFLLRRLDFETTVTPPAELVTITNYTTTTVVATPSGHDAVIKPEIGFAHRALGTEQNLNATRVQDVEQPKAHKDLLMYYPLVVKCKYMLNLRITSQC